MEQTILKQRFPQIELSYETDAHKKVLNSKYDICVSIPTGKKYFAWFTYEPSRSTDACYIIDKQGLHFTQVKIESHTLLSLNTIVYGTLCELPNKFFVIEDIHCYCGLSMKQMTFANKMTFIKQLLDLLNQQNDEPEITFVLPYMTKINQDTLSNIIDDPVFYDSMIDKTAYMTHHVQFRSSEHITSYLNHNYKKNTAKTQLVHITPLVINMPRNDIDYAVALQKKEAVFLVSADVDDDIYHLYCYDNQSETQYTYVDIAYIGTLRESKFMNGLFRNIRENTNIDLGEESEDEDIFQNVSPDKYVDLTKRIKMLCVFHSRWRRWIPVSVVPDNMRVININDIIKKQTTQRNHNQHPPRNHNQSSQINNNQHLQRNHNQHSPRNYNQHSQRNYNQHSQRNYNEHLQRNYNEYPQRNHNQHLQRNYNQQSQRNYNEHLQRDFKVAPALQKSLIL